MGAEETAMGIEEAQGFLAALAGAEQLEVSKLGAAVVGAKKINKVDVERALRFRGSGRAGPTEKGSVVKELLSASGRVEASRRVDDPTEQPLRGEEKSRGKRARKGGEVEESSESRLRATDSESGDGESRRATTKGSAKKKLRFQLPHWNNCLQIISGLSS